MRALYWPFVCFLRVVLAVFFRTREVVGRENIPTEGPVIFVGNHPNSLLDPVVITLSCGRRLHFLAKDTLFRWPPLRLLLDTLGAVPVRRRQDHPGGPLDNRAAFAALYELLRRGGACGIFPEGISHAESDLAPLKTGAARIAFGAATESLGPAPIRIVPCGLTYFRRTRMRSRVLVQFGPPLTIDAARLAAWREDEGAAVRALTADIEASLRALVVTAPDFETLRVADTVRRLYASRAPADFPLAARAELTRRFLDGIERLRERDAEVEATYRAVAHYAGDLRALGLRDADLERPLRTRDVLARVAAHLALLFVFAPLTVPGLVIHGPLLAAAVVAGDGLTRRRDVRATTKLMVTTLCVPFAYAAIVAGLWARWPGPRPALAAAGGALLLPLSGWATIRVLHRQAALRRSVWVLLHLILLRREVERLRAERAHLVARVWGLVERHVDPGLPRIVPAQGDVPRGEDPVA